MSKRGNASHSRSAVVAAALLLAGCTVPVAAGLDEGDANRIVVALDHVGIDATKEIDPACEGKFRVDVTRDDAARAIGDAARRRAPEPRAGGRPRRGRQGGARAEPRARSTRSSSPASPGISSGRSRASMGSLHARVHFNVADADPLRDGPRARSRRRSVLVEHRGATPPIAAGEVAAPRRRRRVRARAGRRRGRARVAPRAADRDGGAQLAHVGPIAVARGSMRALQLRSSGSSLLVAVLAARRRSSLYARLARARADAEAPG